MISPIRRTLIFAFPAIALLLVAPLAFAAQPPIFATSGVAINGYDPVAYIHDKAPIRGSESIEAEWNGAKWRFSTEANKAAFLASPEKYAPQFGGYCAYAVAKGATAPTDPNAFSVVDGKLYLNYSQDVRTIWRKDTSGYINTANGNWPKVLNR